jgi:3-vinyl bacteriochlorophyllide hydratase
MRSNDQNFSDSAKKSGPPPLYTPEQRARRDSTRWTLVQGILAPIQFFIFLVSLVLVLRYLDTGTGAFAANVSVVVKTCALYLIMVTGAIWEKVVFGKYLFVPAFFWEDVFSMLVLALHTAYLVMLFADLGTERERLLLALAAYVTYGINAGQFILKLRAARLQSNAEAQTSASQTSSRTSASVNETPSAPAMAASA